MFFSADFVSLFGAVAALGMWFLVRWTLRSEAARKKEIRKRMALAAAETARAEFEATAGYYTYDSGLVTEPVVVEPVEPSISSSASDSGPVPVRQVQYLCEVCSSPTTTRCKQCKAVHYCSGKCQIINWRQGHKDECLLLSAQRKVDSGLHFGLEEIESDEAVGLSYELPNSVAGGFKDNNGVGESIHDGEITDINAKIPFDSSPDVPAASTVPLNSIVASDDRLKDFNTTGSRSEWMRPRNGISASYSDEKSESPNSSVSSLASSEDHSLSEPSTPSHGFWEGAAERIHSKMDAVDDFDDRNRSISLSSGRGTKFYDKVSGSDSTRVVPLEVFKNDLHRKLSSGISQRSGLSDSEEHTLNRGDHQFMSPDEVGHEINGKSTGLETKKWQGNDSSKSKSSESYVSTSSGTAKHSEWSRKDDICMLDKRGCSETNTNRTNPFNRRVVDHLEASRVTGHSSSRTKNGVVSRYEGSFLYEHFVKLYNWNGVELCPCGLVNCGNSCYANAVLQCLAFTPPLTAYFLQGLHSKDCRQNDWCFSCEFEALIRKANQSKYPVSPGRIMSEVERIGSHLVLGREEDSHEFLRYAIDSMQRICLKEAGVKAATPVDEETTLLGFTFGGYTRSKIECMRCGGKSEQHERMMDLAVEIAGDVATLEDALTQFTHSEILDGENKYLCSRCKSYEKAKKKLKVMEAPNILTIVLKRFQNGKYGKLNKRVKFPAILNMAPYMTGTSDKSPIYQLYGVVVHMDFNNASFSGHYICYVKNNQGRWFEANDTMVEEVRLEKVLSRDAYMLFYARCSPRAPKILRSLLVHPTPKTKSHHHHSLDSWNVPSRLSVPGFSRSYTTLTHSISEDDTLSEYSSSFFSDVGSSSNGESTSTGDCSDHMGNSWD